MVNEERDNIEELDREVDRENLLYEFKGKTEDIDFSKYISSIDMMIGIRDGGISITNVILNQNSLSNEKAEISVGNPKDKSKKKFCNKC